MARAALIEKLNDHITRGITREADVVYLLIEVGKYIEQLPNSERTDFPTLKFYRNWVAHSRIDKLNQAGDIPTELNNAISDFLLTGDSENLTSRVAQAISFQHLHSELKRFLNTNGTATDLLEDTDKWIEVAKLLIGVLADVPLIFPSDKFPNVISFSFTEVISRGTENRVATWVIESPGNVFQGPVFLS